MANDPFDFDEDDRPRRRRLDDDERDELEYLRSKQRGRKKSTGKVVAIALCLTIVAIVVAVFLLERLTANREGECPVCGQRFFLERKSDQAEKSSITSCPKCGARSTYRDFHNEAQRRR